MQTTPSTDDEITIVSGTIPSFCVFLKSTGSRKLVVHRARSHLEQLKRTKGPAPGKMRRVPANRSKGAAQGRRGPQKPGLGANGRLLR